MKSILLIIFYLVLSLVSFSQWNYLSSFAENMAGTYTDLGTNGTAITTNYAGGPMGFDNEVSSIQDIGFAFTYDGQVFNKFVLSSNGFIKLGTVAPANNVHDILASSETNVISPFNYYLLASLPLDGAAEYRVFTSGSAPNKVCTIQFENLRDYRISLPSQSQFAQVNFQINLYELSNTIEFVYGTFIGRHPGSAFNIVVGAKGSTNLNLVVASKMSQYIWGLTTFLNSPTYFLLNGGASYLPDAGRTYRFISGTIPLKLLNFTASKDERSNLLMWSTAQETNTKEFVVERSDAGIAFTATGTIQASGHSSSEKYYRFTDKTHKRTLNFYRLKMVDVDGKFTYSPVRKVDNREMDATVFPIPIDNVLHLRWFAETHGDGVIKIVDINGRLLYEKHISVLSGENTREVGMRHFSTGIYFVNLTYADKVVVKQVSKY